VADTREDLDQKRDYYLQLMNRARQLNDQALIRLITKKMVHLGMTNAVSTTSGCMIIPFPLAENTTRLTDDVQLTWWTLLKLTLAVPGSLVALFLLARYSM
jgi:hypothetical protein